MNRGGSAVWGKVWGWTYRNGFLEVWRGAGGVLGCPVPLICLRVTPLEGRAPGRGGVTIWHSAE